jgi:hypothetical protein
MSARVPSKRDDAIIELAQSLYEHMEVEDPYEEKSWDDLLESEREFYVSAIYHVLSWKDTVLTALGLPQHSDNNPINRRLDDSE